MDRHDTLLDKTYHIQPQVLKNTTANAVHVPITYNLRIVFKDVYKKVNSVGGSQCMALEAN